MCVWRLLRPQRLLLSKQPETYLWEETRLCNVAMLSAPYSVAQVDIDTLRERIITAQRVFSNTEFRKQRSPPTPVECQKLVDNMSLQYVHSRLHTGEGRYFHHAHTDSPLLLPCTKPIPPLHHSHPHQFLPWSSPTPCPPHISAESRRRDCWRSDISRSRAPSPAAAVRCPSSNALTAALHP